MSGATTSYSRHPDEIARARAVAQAIALATGLDAGVDDWSDYSPTYHIIVSPDRVGQLPGIIRKVSARIVAAVKRYAKEQYPVSAEVHGPVAQYSYYRDCGTTIKTRTGWQRTYWSVELSVPGYDAVRTVREDEAPRDHSGRLIACGRN